MIANSRHFADAAVQPLALLLADVPLEVVAQARTRRQKLDLQTDITEFLKELSDLTLLSLSTVPSAPPDALLSLVLLDQCALVP
jgi:hypothetical protein